MNAPEKAIQIKAAITAFITFFTALWGYTGWAIVILIVCIALDYVTGTWAAMQAGEWSSASARTGLWHKLGEIIALLVAALCDIALKVITQEAVAGKLDFDLPNATLTILVCVWYIFTELGSIIENIGQMGAPIPSWLAKAIQKIRDKTDPRTDPQSVITDPENRDDGAVG